jgi:hypothetical protein
MFMNTKSRGYGEDTGWKARYRLSTLNFGPHKRSLNTNTGPVIGGVLPGRGQVVLPLKDYLNSL